MDGTYRQPRNTHPKSSINKHLAKPRFSRDIFQVFVEPNQLIGSIIIFKDNRRELGLFSGWKVSRPIVGSSFLPWNSREILYTRPLTSMVQWKMGVFENIALQGTRKHIPPTGKAGKIIDWKVKFCWDGIGFLVCLEGSFLSLGGTFSFYHGKKDPDHKKKPSNTVISHSEPQWKGVFQETGIKIFIFCKMDVDNVHILFWNQRGQPPQIISHKVGMIPANSSLLGKMYKTCHKIMG